MTGDRNLQLRGAVSSGFFFLNFSGGCFSGKRKAHKHKSFWPVTPPVTGGSPDQEARGQSFMCYPRNPRNISLFLRIPEDTRQGGPVTEATGKSFMYKSFMCLFCFRAVFWGGDATKHFSVKKKGFSVKRGGAIQ